MSIFSKWFSNNEPESSTFDEPRKPQLSASDYCEQGQKSLDAGKYVEAMEYFQAAIEADKRFEKAYFLLSEVYEKQGKKDKAKAAIYSLLAVEPSNENALKRIEVLTKDIRTEKSNNVDGNNDGENDSDSIQDSGKNDNGVTQQSQPIQVGNYRIFDGKPEDRFDFFVIFDNGNRLYFKIKNTNEIAVVSPAKYGWEGYKKPSGKIDIPSFVDFKGQQYIVRSIAEYAFSLCKAIQFVKIPDTVLNIELAGFNKCSSLSSVILPSMLESLGDSCFYECGFDSIKIPESVKFIGKSAFCRCSYLASFRFPIGVTKIEKNVLTGCPKLSQIVIPENVIEIEQGAFGDEVFGYRGANNVELCVECTDPPKISASLFQVYRSGYEGFTKVTVIVPKGTLDAYITTQYWQEFDIREEC